MCNGGLIQVSWKSVLLLNILPAPRSKDDRWIAQCVTEYRLRAFEGDGQVFIYLHVPEQSLNISALLARTELKCKCSVEHKGFTDIRTEYKPRPLPVV